MSVFVTADLHLSTHADTNKSMEVFGGRWIDYTERLEKAWRALVAERDTVVIAGDISWALTLEEALSDLSFIHRLPGQKILLKGNHDFWWSTASKLAAFCQKHKLDSLHFLHNNAYVADDFLICGTRGWFHDSTADGAKHAMAEYDKVVARECVRLSLSVEAADKLARETERPLERICFLHFPPLWADTLCQPIIDGLKKHDIHRLYFGHIHGASPTHFVHDGIDMTLISADALGFVPQILFHSENWSSTDQRHQ